MGRVRAERASPFPTHHPEARDVFRLIVALGLLFGGTVSRVEAQAVPPDAHWSSFETEHFTVTFSEGLEPLARRAADRAERAYAILQADFLAAPDDRIELLVTDHVDLSNGSADPFPRNRIVVYAQPPISEPSLSLHDDWLGQLIIHELVHVFHLDYAEGIWSSLRHVLGRSPYLFPAIFSPGWLIEGLATYYESAFTRGGRIRGSTYDMMLRAAVLQDSFFGIDAVSLDPITWPGGTARYIYGGLFLDYLADRHGDDRVPKFLRDLGGEIIPYRLDAAAQRTFGAPLTELWRSWEDSLRTSHAALRDTLELHGLTEPELLTLEGRGAFSPRYSPDGSAIVFAASTGRAEADLRLLRTDGSIESLTQRSSLGAADWIDGGELLYAQMDFDGRTRLFSDLYRLSAEGDEDRLTHRSRIWEADAHPDNHRAIAVRSVNGTNVLSFVDLSTGRIDDLFAPSLDVYWASPRWSPDGATIAVSRWSEGFYDLVLLDEQGRLVKQVTSDRAIDSAPAWSRDGRYVFFSSDRTGIANLYAFEISSSRLWQVTNVLTGAFQPDVSPDQRWIAFSYYLADGYHIARLPFAPGSWLEASAPTAGLDDIRTPAAALEARFEGPISRYSAWGTLGPTTWTPLLATRDEIGSGIGVAVDGEDAVERHAWALAVLGYPRAGLLEGSGTYTYRGLGNPVLDFRITQGWEQRSERAVEGAELEDVQLRDREVEARTSWLLRSWRSATSLEAGAELTDIHRQRVEAIGADAAPLRDYPLDLGAFIGAAISTRRGYTLSLGVQDGFLLGTRLEARRYLADREWISEPGYWRSTSRAQAFRGFDWFGYAPSVLAARVNLGFEGDGGSSGFRLGGASGEDPVGSSSSTSYPVRGYSADVQRGDRVASASLEYRFPIALVERGFGLFPVGVGSVWGDLFADAGTAWCATNCGGVVPSASTSPNPLFSVGAEAIIDLRLGYLTSFPLRGGIAFPLDQGFGEPKVYLGVGPSF